MRLTAGPHTYRLCCQREVYNAVQQIAVHIRRYDAANGQLEVTTLAYTLSGSLLEL